MLDPRSRPLCGELSLSFGLARYVIFCFKFADHPLIAFAPPQPCTSSPRKSRYTGIPNYSIFSNENTHGPSTRFWGRPHPTFAKSTSLRSATTGIDLQLCCRKCMASMSSISGRSGTALRLAQTVTTQVLNGLTSLWERRGNE